MAGHYHQAETERVSPKAQESSNPISDFFGAIFGLNGERDARQKNVQGPHESHHRASPLHHDNTKAIKEIGAMLNSNHNKEALHKIESVLENAGSQKEFNDALRKLSKEAGGHGYHLDLGVWNPKTNRWSDAKLINQNDELAPSYRVAQRGDSCGQIVKDELSDGHYTANERSAEGFYLKSINKLNPECKIMRGQLIELPIIAPKDKP